jgi:hypothetical protein
MLTCKHHPFPCHSPALLFRSCSFSVKLLMNNARKTVEFLRLETWMLQVTCKMLHMYARVSTLQFLCVTTRCHGNIQCLFSAPYRLSLTNKILSIIAEGWHRLWFYGKEQLGRGEIFTWNFGRKATGIHRSRRTLLPSHLAIHFVTWRCL